MNRFGLRETRHARWFILLVSVALYIAACKLPALVFHVQSSSVDGKTTPSWEGYSPENGFTLLCCGLIFGWIYFNFAAFANPLLWLSWWMLARGKATQACVSSIGALLLSAQTLQLRSSPWPYDEGGVRKGFLAWPGIGFYFWLLSMIAILFSSVSAMLAQRNQKTEAVFDSQ